MLLWLCIRTGVRFPSAPPIKPISINLKELEMCNCRFCRIYHRYRWAVIKECLCGCHKNKYPSGHDSLCCEFPNGRIKDIPYKSLKSAAYYSARLKELHFE